ncbi:MAG TPA: DUF6069 family protein [Acidimicrobiia bacterium]|nr:DUF6069 family protein [Acidimicrobiia bacterium]
MAATNSLTVPIPSATTPSATTPQWVAPRTHSTKQLWKAAGVAGIAASVATTIVAGVASAAGVSLDVGGQSIPLPAFAQFTIVGTIIGTVVAIVLSHRAGRPRRTFVVTTMALTLASIVPDVLADAHTATKLTLALTHVVAAAIVIPALASRLTD